MSKVFANGFIFKKPHEKAPDFVKGKLSLRSQEAIQFIKDNDKNGWVNLDLCKSKEGKLYFSLDDFEPTSEKEAQTREEVVPNSEDIPF